MATAKSKQKLRRGRRRLAAINFLSNITLDGTYNDTKIGFLNRRLAHEDNTEEDLNGVRKTLVQVDIESDCNLTHLSDAATISNTATMPVASTISNLLQTATLTDNGLIPISSKPAVLNDVDLADKSTRSSSSPVIEPSTSVVSRRKLIAAHGSKSVGGLIPAASLSGSSKGSSERIGLSPHVYSLSRRGIVKQDSESLLSPFRRWRASPESDQSTPEERANSYSSDHENKAPKRSLIHLYTDSSSSSVFKKGSVERIAERLSRRSSSMSAESTDSTRDSREIRYIDPNKKKPFKRGRLLFVSDHRHLVMASSILPYTQSRIHKTDITDDPRFRHGSGGRQISTFEVTTGLQALVRGEEIQDVSYAEFLVPTCNQNLKKVHSHDGGLLQLEQSHSLQSCVPVHRSYSHDPSVLHSRSMPQTDRMLEEQRSSNYDPNLLDDPDLSCGSYKTIMTFSSYIASVIDYVKPSELKTELNEKFRERFPHVQLTLSKLRSLKRGMRQIGYVKCGVDLWTISTAYVFFEKLILKHLINKANRKSCAGACLILSAKMNDVKGVELSKLIQEIEDEFRVHRRDLLAFEMAVLVALEFSLHILDQEVYPHYQRLTYQT